MCSIVFIEGSRGGGHNAVIETGCETFCAGRYTRVRYKIMIQLLSLFLSLRVILLSSAISCHNNITTVQINLPLFRLHEKICQVWNNREKRHGHI